MTINHLTKEQAAALTNLYENAETNLIFFTQPESEFYDRGFDYGFCHVKYDGKEEWIPLHEYYCEEATHRTFDYDLEPTVEQDMIHTAKTFVDPKDEVPLHHADSPESVIVTGSNITATTARRVEYGSGDPVVPDRLYYNKADSAFIIPMNAEVRKPASVTDIKNRNIPNLNQDLLNTLKSDEDTAILWLWARRGYNDEKSLTTSYIVSGDITYPKFARSLQPRNLEPNFETANPNSSLEEYVARTIETRVAEANQSLKHIITRRAYGTITRVAGPLLENNGVYTTIKENSEYLVAAEHTKRGRTTIKGAVENVFLPLVVELENKPAES